MSNSWSQVFLLMYAWFIGDREPVLMYYDIIMTSGTIKWLRVTSFALKL